MSRLILTENVNRVIQKAFDDGRFSCMVGQYLMDRIAEIPEGLVRCKDCKWFEEYTEDGVSEGIGFCTNPVFDVYNILKTDWFCADGERKEQRDG